MGEGNRKIRIFVPFSGKIRIARGKFLMSWKKYGKITCFVAKIMAKVGEMPNIPPKPS